VASRSNSATSFCTFSTETPSIKVQDRQRAPDQRDRSSGAQLASLLEEKGQPEGALRLKVTGGGCSGLQYVMDLVDGRWSATSLFRLKAYDSLLIQKARYSLAAPCSIQRGFAKSGFKSDEPQCRRSLLLRRKFRRLDPKTGLPDYTFMTSASLCLRWSSMDLTKRSVSFCHFVFHVAQLILGQSAEALSFFASSSAVRRFERTRTRASSAIFPSARTKFLSTFL